jgi:hypothetical protein
VREATGISAFGEEGEETPIEIVPDVVLDEAPPSESKSKAKTGAQA